MPIFENNRIRVTLTESQATAWQNDRANILSRAMQILSNRSEAALMEKDTYSDDEYIAEGIEAFFSDHIVENFPDNCGELFMRLRGGYKIPQQWQPRILEAQEIAKSKSRQETITRGKKAIEFSTSNEKKYRHRFDKNDWKIEIIGDMPKQIGMCRFSFDGIEMIEATVKPHSTSAHVGLPKRWTGCRVTVVRLDEGSETTEPR